MARSFGDLLWGECRETCLELIGQFPLEAQELLIARDLKQLDLHTHVIGVALADHPWDRREMCKWIKCEMWTLELFISGGRKLRAAPLDERKKWLKCAEGFMTPQVVSKVHRLLGIKKSPHSMEMNYSCPHEGYW